MTTELKFTNKYDKLINDIRYKHKGPLKEGVEITFAIYKDSALFSYIKK